MKDKFSDWLKWNDLFWDKRRDKPLSEKLCYPGIYVIAKIKKLSTREFAWISDIVYIGMTSRTLWERLNEFKRTIKNYNNEPQHGGADRIRLEYKRLQKEKELKTWLNNVYFSFYVFKNTSYLKGKIKDILIKKELISICEYYMANKGRIPKYNDFEKYPKSNYSEKDSSISF